MQVHDIQITVNTLLGLGQKQALISLRDNLKRDYELARDAVATFEGVENVDVPIIAAKVVEANKPLLYSKEWSYAEKFVYILKSQQRFMKFREAARIIIEIEGDGDETKITRKLTIATSNLKKEGKIVKVSKGGHANTFWGLSRWLDKEGNIKEGYEYKKSALKRKSSSEKVKSGVLDDL